MSRLTKHADLIILQSLLQGTIATCAMGVEDIACFRITLTHGLTDLFVTIRGTADKTADSLMALAIEVVDTCEVGGITHIHRIGKSLHGSFRLVLPCLQVFIEDVVGIIGSNEPHDRQSHLVSEQGRADIAEVTTGHTDNELRVES